MRAFRPLPVDRIAYPAICAPLVARTQAALAQEAADVAAKQPDLLEWRVDFFEGLADAKAVAAALESIHAASGGLALLFTRRSSKEGGEPIAASEDQVLSAYAAACGSGRVALVDFEMGNDPAHVRRVREQSLAHGVKLVLSFHDFAGTPEAAVLDEKFALAQELGADVAKVAVMPRSMDDVLRLLAATLRASQSLRIPVVSMSMGGPGALTRLCGAQFGSAMTSPSAAPPPPPDSSRSRTCNTRSRCCDARGEAGSLFHRPTPTTGLRQPAVGMGDALRVLLRLSCRT